MALDEIVQLHNVEIRRVGENRISFWHGVVCIARLGLIPETEIWQLATDDGSKYNSYILGTLDVIPSLELATRRAVLLLQAYGVVAPPGDDVATAFREAVTGRRDAPTSDVVAIAQDRGMEETLRLAGFGICRCCAQLYKEECGEGAGTYQIPEDEIDGHYYRADGQGVNETPRGVQLIHRPSGLAATCGVHRHVVENHAEALHKLTDRVRAHRGADV